MKHKLALASLILLCFSMAGSIGGGLYEKLVLNPLWSASPPASFVVIHPGTTFFRSHVFCLDCIDLENQT